MNGEQAVFSRDSQNRLFLTLSKRSLVEEEDVEGTVKRNRPSIWLHWAQPTV